MKRLKKIIIPKHLPHENEEKWKQSYDEMADINLAYAETLLQADNSQLRRYEESLKELEKAWSLKEETSFTPT